jgi:hypothetical protein
LENREEKSQRGKEEEEMLASIVMDREAFIPVAPLSRHRWLRRGRQKAASDDGRSPLGSRGWFFSTKSTRPTKSVVKKSSNQSMSKSSNPKIVRRTYAARSPTRGAVSPAGLARRRAADSRRGRGPAAGGRRGSRPAARDGGRMARPRATSTRRPQRRQARVFFIVRYRAVYRDNRCYRVTPENSITIKYC